jgi:hypothetical protein
LLTDPGGTVQRLRRVRRLPAGERERDRAVRPRPSAGRSEPLDDGNLWLTTAQVAELLGVSVVAVNKRCRSGRVPYVEKAGRRWLRMDLLEQVELARAAQQLRSPWGGGDPLGAG